MRGWVVAALALGAACGPGDPAPPPDLSRPEGPVEALVTAARLGDPSHLSGLCLRDEDLDSDARRVCAAGPDRPDDWELVQDWFEGARIEGAPRLVDEDRAELDVVFGEASERRATFVVRRQEGKWYLSAF